MVDYRLVLSAAPPFIRGLSGPVRIEFCRYGVQPGVRKGSLCRSFGRLEGSPSPPIRARLDAIAARHAGCNKSSPGGDALHDSCVEAKHYLLAVRRALGALLHKEAVIQMTSLSSSAEDYILVHSVRTRGGRKRANLRERTKLSTRLQHPGGDRDRVRRVADRVTAAAEQTPILQYPEEHAKDARPNFSVSSRSTAEQGCRLTVSASRPPALQPEQRGGRRMCGSRRYSPCSSVSDCSVASSSSSRHSVGARTNSILPRRPRLAGRPS